MTMLTVEQSRKISIMREAGEILSTVLREVCGLIEPGVTTRALDDKAVELFEKYNVKPAFLGYRGFPNTICSSVNDEVVHGIPGERVLENGDILSIDIGLIHNGYYSDMAVTLPVGDVSAAASDIMDAGKQTLQKAVEILKPYLPLRELSGGIQEYAENRGYNVLRQYVGHEIGEKMHEELQIPNFVNDIYPPADILLEPGIVIAIEPMLTEGTFEVDVADDGWTVYTRDRKLSVHFEYTVAILDDGVEVLTLY